MPGQRRGFDRARGRHVVQRSRRIAGQDAMRPVGVRARTWSCRRIVRQCRPRAQACSRCGPRPLDVDGRLARGHQVGDARAPSRRTAPSRWSRGPGSARRPGCGSGPSTGGPSGSIGRAPFQALRLRQPCRAGEPVVQHLVQRAPARAAFMRLGRAADLGAAGHADALAEAARSRPCSVSSMMAPRGPATWAARSWLQRRGHRVAVHRRRSAVTGRAA